MKYNVFEVGKVKLPSETIFGRLTNYQQSTTANDAMPVQYQAAATLWLAKAHR